MSKTDKTRPAWVQIASRDVTPREVHDHRNGVCEIAGAQPTREHIDFPAQKGACFFTYEYDGKNFGCGCPLCTQQAMRKAENRRTRHGKRKDIDERLEEP